MATLGARVELEDERCFVGREAELAALCGLLEGESQQRVAIVHGPGGIGKSTLLRELRRRATRSGWQVRAIDGRDGIPTSQDLVERVSGVDPDCGLLLLVDTYERLTSLGGFIRSQLLPELPEKTIVVIALRGLPDAGWMHGGWERVTRSLALAPISPAESRELLTREGIVDEATARALIDWGHGSPLALRVGADALRAGGSWGARQLDDHPEVAELLLRRLTEGELDSSRFDVAAVASIARRTDASLLADVLPGIDGKAAEQWLRSCSFVEPLDGGLTLHELVRVALRAQVRKIYPERERELRRRIVEYIYRRAVAGETGLVADLAELVQNETLRWGLGGEGLVGMRADSARLQDVESLAQSELEAARRGASEWLQATLALVREAPRCALVARDDDDEVCGLCIAVTPQNAPAGADRDPVLGPWLAHAREHYPDGNVLIWRDSLDFTHRHGDRSSRVLAVLNSAAIIRSELANPRRAYLPIDPANVAATEFARSVGAKRIEGLDVHFDDRVQECHLLDYGRGGLLARHRAAVYAELGLRPPDHGEGTDGVGAAEISAETVREALRSIDRPLELSRSPIARGDTPRERAASVRGLIAEASESAFGDEPGERLLLELVRLRYLGEPLTHELVADRLNISRATYFRHLRVVFDRIADYVIQREAGG